MVLKEFNKVIIPFALVGYETGYSQLASPRWLFTISYPTRAHGVIVNYYYHLLHYLSLLAVRYCFFFASASLQGKANPIADSLSRFQFQCFRCLPPLADREAPPRNSFVALGDLQEL